MPKEQQHYSLRWNNYLRHITFTFDFLRRNNDLVDVTLCCEGKRIKAHKVLLSACSGYFKEIFKDNPHPHPVIIFKFIKFEDLNAIIEFMYQGKVNVKEDALQSFLQTAEILMVHGLTSDDKTSAKTIKSHEQQTVYSTESRRTTTDSITQTTNIDFLKSYSNSPKKRKISFSEDEEIENDLNEIITFTKNEIQFTPSSTNTNIPEFVDVSNCDMRTKIITQTAKSTPTKNLSSADTDFEIETQEKNQQNPEIVVIEKEKLTVPNDQPDLVCKICNRQLQSISAYRRHNASKHGQKSEKYNCLSCEKSFKTKWSLSTHNSRFHRNKEKEVIKMSFNI
ncbi:protein bric-a-brac 1-like [Condylostylus longicornis]|uniref:protein bric-a-brac 1-like n=1 Tax=Condylostylus longicornis TaxID=2530218 RepID=UPI00244E5989|nr:protein bric-a-brac 1-like [Condylostylus longicornis]